VAELHKEDAVSDLRQQIIDTMKCLALPRKVVAIPRPSIEDLERILNQENPPPVQLEPDGSVTEYQPQTTTVEKVADAILALLNAPTKEPDRDEPIEQFDPVMQAIQGEPWFMQAALLVERAAAILTENGVHKGTLFAGGGRLSLDDPFAGALIEIASLPAEGLAFAVVKVPDLPDALDDSRKLHELSEKVRAANPNASLLLLPGDWSFRTMHPEMARQFSQNMLAFVSDDELAKVGLYRKEPT
jgi:hypothetical protein